MIGPTPLLDFFKRGEVERDVKMLAAQGTLAPRAYEQLAILVLLLDDPDVEIRATAEGTLDRIPVETLRGFLARADIPIGMREFFGDRGIFPAEIPALETDVPLFDIAPEEFGTDPPEAAGAASETAAEPAAEEAEAEPDEDENTDRLGAAQKLAKMTFPQRLKAAVKGTREMRAILIRDPNKMIASSVLSSPKVSEPEIAGFAKMQNVSEDVLRIIAANRAWTKNYTVVLALTKNPKTPMAMSLNFLNRLTNKDVAMISVDRNVPEALRIAARKKAAAARAGSG